MSLSINGTNGLTFSDGTSQNTAATGFGFKNRIINGAMMIDQRNAGAALTVNNGALFTLDRWMVEDGTTTGVLSVQQVSDAPTGFINSLKVTASTGTGTIGANEYAVITQFIEGLNCSDLAWGSSSASSVTVSFWVKASNTGNYSCTLYNNGASRINPQSFTVNSANTWEQKTITFTGDTTGTWLTTNGRGIIVNFYITLGSTYLSTAGWNGSSKYGVTGQGNAITTTNNTFQITGVQLEKGSTATSFDYRPYGTELALCQRYFAMSFSQGVVPTNGLDKAFVRNIVPYSSTNGYTDTIEFPVQMRTIPSVAAYSSNAGSGSTWQYYNGGWVNATSTIAYNISTNGFYFEPVGTFTQWSPRLCMGHYTASAEL